MHSLYQEIFTFEIGEKKKNYGVHKAILVMESETIADLFRDRAEECKTRLKAIIDLLQKLPRAVSAEKPHSIDAKSNHLNTQVANALTSGVIGATVMYLQNTEADLLSQMCHYFKLSPTRDPAQLPEEDDKWQSLSDAYYQKIWKCVHTNHFDYLNFLVEYIIGIAEGRLEQLKNPYHLPYSRVYNRPLDFPNITEAAFDVFVHALYTEKVEGLNMEGTAMIPVPMSGMVEALSIAEQLRVPRVVKAIMAEIDRRSVSEVLAMDMEDIHEFKGLLAILEQWNPGYKD
ncbi:hypothetical protein EJ08DRAFT_734161 [Tothia fuscella]|uniref:BTB domain-containing protein n=1 Tax=Tothia fuscella TaxID=1048955 RepID=A0A9P4NQU5_9PEZI|nr:hypothetical protein EJ08DRAFT_734161 [Tothia fuscella]